VSDLGVRGLAASICDDSYARALRTLGAAIAAANP
jgi:hypothetical protein